MLRVYKIFRDILTWLLGGILIALVGEFAIDLAREHGFFDRPTERVEAVGSLLAAVRDQFWFLPAVAFLTGLVAGMWLDSLVRRRQKTRVATETHALPTSATEVAVPASTPQKVFIDASPSFLTGLYENRTSLQGDALAAFYIGKWITVTGRVLDISDISPTSGSGPILVQFDSDGKFIGATFSIELARKISHISNGATITVRGEIETIDARRLKLKKCELVEISPS